MKSFSSAYGQVTSPTRVCLKVCTRARNSRSFDIFIVQYPQAGRRQSGSLTAIGDNCR